VAEPAEAGDDDRVLLVDGVGFPAGRSFVPTRGRTNRSRTASTTGVSAMVNATTRRPARGDVTPEHALRVREGQQHEREFADLREASANRRFWSVPMRNAAPSPASTSTFTTITAATIRRSGRAATQPARSRSTRRPR